MTSTTDELNYEIAARMLRSARHAVALTGAGVSTPSGVPDFRSPHSGLWEKADPFEVASLIGFRFNPQKFFDWMRPLTDLMVTAQPNPAHFALAEMEAMGYLKGIITQNIDMLHSRAGSNTLYEIHGHMREATCVECFKVYKTDSFIEEFRQTGAIPRCPACNGILKPNVILFGEQLPVQVLHGARRESQRCDLMLVAGSSLTVAPASGFPMEALAHGARLIIVNYEETYVDDQASVIIRDDVAVALPRIAEHLKP